MRPSETYNDQIVRLFLLAAAVWGIVGMSIGVYAAAEMAWPALNFGVPWLTFSRIRPDHTFGVIFAFGGSALMGTCYYVVQRTGHTRRRCAVNSRHRLEGVPADGACSACESAPTHEVDRRTRSNHTASAFACCS